MNSVHPVDSVIRLQLLDYVQGGADFADGLVLAGTIVEGGPVKGRRRKILGGKQIFPGLSGLPYFRQNEQMDTCLAANSGMALLVAFSQKQKRSAGRNSPLLPVPVHKRRCFSVRKRVQGIR